MSDSEPPKRSGKKLSPLSLNISQNDTNDVTPRRKKRKPPQNPDGSESEATSRRSAPRESRVRSSSRTRAQTRDSEDGISSVRESPRRIRKTRKPSSVDSPDAMTEDTDGQSPKPRKKRKPRARPQGEESNLENGHTANGDLPSDRTSRDRRKKRKKRKAQVSQDIGHTNLGLEAELDELSDDVVVTDTTETYDENWRTPAMMSKPVNKVFIEQRSGFKSANRVKLDRKRAEEQRRALEPPAPPQTKNTIQFAISSHRVFKTIVLFFQGLLSGICLWQIVTVYMLSNQGYDVLLEQYYKLAMPVQGMYYFLFALSTVAVFDRNDVARPTRRFVLRSATLQSGAIACLFYLAGLVFSLAIANIDDKIGLYKKQPDLWADTQARDSQLKLWVILNLVRGLMPMLGWFVVSLRPGSDRLIKNLEKADENIIGEELYQDENGAVRSSGV